MTLKKRWIGACSGIALLIGALAMMPVAAAGAPLNVVASFSIIADLAQHVGGERVRITTLVGPDGDTHVYEPKPADAVAVSRADVVLVNGLQLEGFLPRLVKASGTRAPIVELSRGVDALPAPDFDGHEQDHHGAHNHAHDHSHDSEHYHAHGPSDPHAWQSVRNVRIYVDNIASAFCAVDAGGCASYRSNTEAYNRELAALDQRIRATVASLPADRRTVITSHDAFGYFQRDYGITFLAPEGVSTAAEASAADVAALIRQARQDQAAALFVENISDPRLVQQIAREAGIGVGGKLYSDALSTVDGPAPTYVQMMEYNVDALTEALAPDHARPRGSLQ